MITRDPENIISLLPCIVSYHGSLRCPLPTVKGVYALNQKRRTLNRRRCSRKLLCVQWMLWCVIGRHWSLRQSCWHSQVPAKQDIRSPLKCRRNLSKLCDAAACAAHSDLATLKLLCVVRTRSARFGGQKVRSIVLQPHYSKG